MTTFDAQGRPTDGVDPNLGHFTATYDTRGDVTETYDSGAVRDYNAAGALTGGFDPGKGGGHFTVAPDGSGGEVWTYDSGMVRDYNAAGALTGGFDPGKGGGHFTVAPDGSGGEVWTYDSGMLRDYNAAGVLVGGTDPGLGPFTVTYDQSSGDATWTFDSGYAQVFDPGGNLIRIGLPDGVEVPAHIEQNSDGTSTIIATLTVDGQTYQGSFDSKWNFFSSDGKTEITGYGTAQVQVLTGVTDPSTDQFIVGGTTKTLADGTVLYGFAVGSNGFITYDGTEIVWGDLVLTGTYDKTTGIFTTTNGDYIFVGQDGLQIAVYRQSDEAYVLWDGSVVMTPQSWKVDLQQLLDCKALLQSRANSISDEYAKIVEYLTLLEIDGGLGKVAGWWFSPAADTFPDVRTQMYNALSLVGEVLTDTITQIQQSHDNYVLQEEANLQNVGSLGRSAA
jgi:hypothetical protein